MSIAAPVKIARDCNVLRLSTPTARPGLVLLSAAAAMINHVEGDRT